MASRTRKYRRTKNSSQNKEIGGGRKARNYVAEYARRIARALAKGLTKSQGRGHPKPTENGFFSKRPRNALADDKLQRALRVLRQEQNISAAARSVRISPERLKHVAAAKGAIKQKGRRWIVNPELPRRMALYSRGRQIAVTVGGVDQASLIGRYMSAVGRFRETNDRSLLLPFDGKSVTDISGKSHPLETNPNSLYRLATAGGESFEAVYRIVI